MWNKQDNTPIDWVRVLSSTILSLYLSLTSQALAAPITISDTAGFTRASAEITNSCTVEFHVVGTTGEKLDNAKITITEKNSGQKMTAVSLAGIATHEQVPSGEWVVSTTTSDITFTDVVIKEDSQSIVAADLAGRSANLLPKTSTLLAIGGLATVGGVIALAVDDASSSSSSPISPSK
jgi:hypothetical protein